MDESTFKFIFFLVFLFVALAIIIAYYVITEKIKEKVSTFSYKLNALKNINHSTRFYTFETTFYYSHDCSSKRQFDAFSQKEYFINILTENYSLFSNIANKITSNKTTYNEYITKVRSIESTASLDYCKKIHIPFKLFIKYENQMFKNAILHPILDLTIKCYVEYSSPQGRNHYSNSAKYNYNDLIANLGFAKTRLSEKGVMQYFIEDERSKMTESLRYDILKRDNFRCQICGATAQDGVKLHVDHIIPVSKGGKTVKSNLRTLCSRCNLGKGAKM